MNKTLIIAPAISSLLTAAAGVGLYLAGIISIGPAQEQMEGNPEQETASPSRPSIYVHLDPAFTVSLGGEGGEAQFLQVKLSAATRDENVEEAIRQHMPAIRNAIVLLISSQKADDLSSRAGKEGLRQEVLKELQRVLEESTGKSGIHDVFFTSFTLQ